MDSVRGALAAWFWVAGWSVVAQGQITLHDTSFRLGDGADGAVNAVVIQSNGGIVVAGDFRTVNGQSAPRIARLLPDGSLDASFQAGTGADGEISSLLRLPNDELLAAGSFATFNGFARNGLARLGADGQVDESFVVGTGTGAGTDVARGVYALARLADGRLLVGGGFEEWNGTARGGIARLSASGELDSGFAAGTSFQQVVMALLPLPDGRVLVGGWFPQVNHLPEPALTVLAPDGSWPGSAGFSLGLGSGVLALAAQPDGRILVGGRQFTHQETPILLRLNADLTPDSTFVAPVFEQGYASALAVQPDGRVLVGGTFVYVDRWWRRYLVRLGPEGQVDPCFDPGLGLGSAGAESPVRAFTVQSDGRVIVAGGFYGFDGVHQENLVRLLPQGECAQERLVILKSELTGRLEVFATWPPGRTNLLRVSTNLQTWVDPGPPSESFQTLSLNPATASATMFFRLQPAP